MSATTGAAARPLFNDPGLNEAIMRLRAIDHATNLGFLAMEYACLAAVIGGAIAFREWRRGAGLPWGWDAPVLALTIVLVGALQHRLAGLGHEAAHYSLLGNKLLNDLVGDVFCLFPILSTLHFYRLFHLAHHQYTNDPARDPDLVTLGASKMVEPVPDVPVAVRQVVLSPGVDRTPGVSQLRAGLPRHQRAGPVGERLPPQPARLGRDPAASGPGSVLCSGWSTCSLSSRASGRSRWRAGRTG